MDLPTLNEKDELKTEEEEVVAVKPADAALHAMVDTRCWPWTKMTTGNLMVLSSQS